MTASMPLAQIQSQNTLLDYSLTTSPAPLQVSAGAKTPSIGSLTIVVSNGGADVTLSSIEIALPVGHPHPEGADLTEVGAGINISLSDSAWQGTYPGKTDGVLWVKPVSGQPIVIGNQGIAITITNITVSTEPGTAFLKVTETATDSNKKPAPLQTVIAVPKFPIGFAAGNFSMTSPVIQNGGRSTMTWFGTQSTGITYTIVWSGAPVDVSTVLTWTSPPLTDVTTFILEVQAQTANGPVKLRFPATQIVADPSIVAQSLKVLGTSTLEGAVTTGPPGDLTVNGAFTATGTAQAKTVAATTKLSGPEASITAIRTGTLNVATSAVFAAGSTLAGALNAMGASVQALTNAIPIQPGTYRPNTDGFVLGMVSAPPDRDRGYLCVGTIMVTVDITSAIAFAMGGNLVALDSRGKVYGVPNYGSAILPVSKGSTATLSVFQDAQNEVAAPTEFAFIPLGSDKGAALIDRVSDDQAPDPGYHSVAAKQRN